MSGKQPWNFRVSLNEVETIKPGVPVCRLEKGLREPHCDPAA
jgi:hypothetical protein